jgi:hypothetical protein
MVQDGNLKIQRVWEDTEKGLLYVEDDSESHLLLKFPEMHRWTEELLHN